MVYKKWIDSGEGTLRKYIEQNNRDIMIVHFLTYQVFTIFLQIYKQPLMSQLIQRRQIFLYHQRGFGLSKQIFFHDPDGNIIEVHEKNRKK